MKYVREIRNNKSILAYYEDYVIRLEQVLGSRGESSYK